LGMDRIRQNSTYVDNPLRLPYTAPNTEGRRCGWNVYWWLAAGDNSRAYNPPAKRKS
jgi:hypothetical protein